MPLSFRLLVVSLALGLTLPLAGLLRTEDDPDLAAGSFREFVDTRLQPTRDAADFSLTMGELPATRAAAWRAFRDAQRDRGPWAARIDRRSGLIEIAEGAGLPWLPGAGNDLRIEELDRSLTVETIADGTVRPTLQALEALSHQFSADIAPLLGVDGRDLRLDRSVSGSYSDFLHVVEFDVFTASGLPIRGARVFFRVNHGNLVQFGAERMPPPGLEPPAAVLGAAEARQAVAAYVEGFDASRDAFLGRPQLFVQLLDTGDAFRRVGEGYTLLPVWQLRFQRQGEHPTWQVLLDATNGEVLELRDVNRYPQITGGYWPVSWRVDGVQQAQVTTGWPYTSVTPTGGTTNTSGVYVWDGSGQTARHEGPFVVINDNCPGAPGSQSTDAFGAIDFGSYGPGGPGDCTTALGIADNTPSARQQFWHLNKIMEKGRAYLPSNLWLQQQLQANVNINNNCNAFWNGATVNFYTSGGGCNNTGEDAGVSMHEWGHGMDSNDGNGASVENGTGETYGDFTAALQTLDSCIGQGFLAGNCGGYGNPCTQCDGVRDIDWGQHSNNAPMTVASFTQTTCPSDVGGGYVGPCGFGAPQPDDKEGHCESYVSSGALWDFAAYDLQTGCSGRSASFPDWNCPGAGGPYTTAGAWSVADRLWYLSRSSADQAFTCNRVNPTWTSDGCNAGSNWKTMRFVDDDDGNLANGTPHSCQLAAAFARHGIACPSDPAWNVCFRGCSQPTAPTLDPPVAGNNLVRLGWSPDPAGDSIDVYRNEIGCNAGFTKVADDLSGTTWDDLEVGNGATYYYQIVRHPPGNESCASPPSTCLSASPTASPSAKYLRGSVTLTSVPTDGDGDGIVDNCDTGRLQITVYNDGDTTLTDTRFTVTSPDPAISITSPMPVIAAASLAVNAQASASFDFAVDGATCQALADFDVAVTADEMALQTTDSFRYGPLEQDVAPAAARTDDFETDADGWTFEGGFARSTASADSGTWSVASSSGVDEACDRAVSPPFRVIGSSQVTLAVRYDIEAFSGGSWWDRANVHAVDQGDGSRTLLIPTGETYDTIGGTISGGLCRISGDDGWAGSDLSWGDAVFDLSVLTPGRDYVLEVLYATDAVVSGTGFSFDNVRWLDIQSLSCDVGGDLCVPCTPPGAPTGLTADASTLGRIDLSWTAVAPAPTSYRIYRATVSGGPYTQVGSVGGGVTSFSDTTVVDGTTYFYVVRAFDLCESTDSNEASATALADCAVPPTFAGLQSVTPFGAAGNCGLRLEWNAGSNQCGSAPVVYNVYRSTTPGFTPGPATLLDSCVTGTSYDDGALTPGSSYFYVVRAEDTAPGGGGVCRDGNEESNTTELSGTASGGTVVLLTETFDALAAGQLPIGWQSGTFSGANAWRGARACPGQSPPNILRYGGTGCTANYPNNSDALALTPAVAVPAGSSGVEVEFYHRWEFEAGFDGGLLYASSATEFPTFYYIPAAYLSGTGYNDIAGGLDVFANEKSPGYDAGTMQVTTVDLAQFCTDTVGFAAECAGEQMYFAWNGRTDISVRRDGWHVDDVTIRVPGTACTPPPAAVDVLTATAGDSSVTVEWLNPTGGSYANTMIRWSTTAPPATPGDGTLLVTQNDGAGAHGSAVHSVLTNGTTYYYSAFIDDGSATFSSPRTTVSARPFSTAGPTAWAYSTGASALAPPGVGSIYAVSNDRVLHSMDTGGGAGVWPASWTPRRLNGSAQGRPPVVPLTVGGATRVIFLGAHDGRVYAVDADSGAELWSTPITGGLVQAAPAVVLAAFGGAADLVLVGTRDAGADNALVALDSVTGVEQWRFDNGGAGSGIGPISGTAALDYAASRVYFTSRARAGGSAGTVWCLDFTGGGATLAWSAPVGDVDGAATVAGGRVYVGTVSGEVVALDALTGAEAWRFDAADGPIKSYLWPRGASSLVFSTTNTVWSLRDDGGSSTTQWSLATIAAPSPPVALALGGTPYVWVGSSDGRLHQLTLAGDGSLDSSTSLPLGVGTAAVGPPAVDPRIDTAFAGTEDGRIHSIALPLP
ncbi:MAG: PQQ-binding-like beta-propeller repeat protein [Acidobacteriota bacterium]